MSITKISNKAYKPKIYNKTILYLIYGKNSNKTFKKKFITQK